MKIPTLMLWATLGLASAQAQTAPASPAAPVSTPAAPAETAPAATPASATPSTAVPDTAAPASAAPAPAAPGSVAAAPVASQSASSLFVALQNYPSLQQAALALEAARAQQRDADFPVAGSISASTTRLLNVDAVPEICASNALLKFTPYCAPLPDSINTVNASVRAMPFNFGDVGARRELARLGVEQAQLGYQTALANLEGQVVLAAQRATLAVQSVALATQAVQTAQMALQATQTRVQGGGGTQNDLNQAELSLAQAQNALTQAHENEALARAALQDLTGSPEIPNLEALTVPASGQPIALQQAQFAERRAEIAYKQAAWNFWPTVQAAYQHRLSTSTSGTSNIGIAIDSHNVVPTATFSYAPVAAPNNRVSDQLTLGVSFDASAASFDAPNLARNALAQAQAGVDAARRQANLQLDSLNTAFAQAQRQYDLAQQALTLAQQTQKDVQARVDLGLAAPLEAAQAAVATFQAQLAADQALLNQTDAATKFYGFFGLPIAPLR